MSERKNRIDQLYDRIYDKTTKCRNQTIKGKYKYILHYVTDGEFPNIHTPGLLVNYGIIDLQIMIFDGDISFSREILVTVIDKIIDKQIIIKNNTSIHYNKYIGFIRVRLIRDDESNMPIYRLILINFPWKLQFDDKDTENNHMMLDY